MNSIKKFTNLFLFLAVGIASASVDAQVTIKINITGASQQTETQVVGLASGRTILPQYGSPRQISSNMLSWTKLNLHIWDLPANHNFILFALQGYCGVFEVTAQYLGGVYYWPAEATVAVKPGTCGPENIDLPWPNPGTTTEIFSAPYMPGPGGDLVLKYEATRSVLIQFGLTSFCSGTCTAADESCSPNRMLIYDPQDQGGTLNKTTAPARQNNLGSSGYSEDRYTPIGAAATARLQGQLYCICVNFTKP